MKRNLAHKMALDMDKKRTKTKPKVLDQEISVKHVSNNMVAAIDHVAELRKYEKLLNRLAETRDVTGFFQDASALVAHELLLTALHDENPKIRFEAKRDLLDRGGHKPVTKHAVARFDSSSSKEEIVSTIMGSKKDLSKVGIEITDDEDNEETTGESDEG